MNRLQKENVLPLFLMLVPAYLSMPVVEVTGQFFYLERFNLLIAIRIPISKKLRRYFKRAFFRFRIVFLNVRKNEMQSKIFQK